MTVTTSRERESEGLCNTTVVTKRLRLENPQGLHARPAVAIVRLLQGAKSTVTFTYKRQTVAANSMLGLLMLAAPKNAWIEVRAEGPDAHDIVAKLEEAFRQKFGDVG
jgi:phosphocarrier protein